MTTTTSQMDMKQSSIKLFSLNKTWPLIGLGLIMLLALILRVYNLNSIGDANRYYTAAVESMLQSPHNFFFVSAEPGGSVTVDKPPLGLWLQAISAYFLGVNGVAVALPQILSGLVSIPLLYWLVKRWWGDVAGLIAAFTLAVTPVAIAAERNNTMDGTLVFFLLLAAWAFIIATERSNLRYLLLGAALVGLGFNIKMMQAFLPLPAFYTLYFFSAKLGWLRKIVYLGLATIVLVAVSLSWAVAVDLVPADQRPYIGSSEDNTVMELIFGHNGLNRLSQETPGGNDGQNTPPDNTVPDGNLAPPDGQANLQPPNGADDGNAGGGGAFSFEVGEPGIFRLFTAPLSNEVSWLLPLGLFAIGLLILSSRIHFPLSIAHQSAVLWGGWLLTAGVFFTIADFFHAYYMIMLGAPLAALVGIGVVRLWQLREHRAWLGGLLLALVSAGTLAYQYYSVAEYVTDYWWFSLAVTGFVISLGLLAWGTVRSTSQFVMTGFAGIVFALLITPTVWSGLTTLDENFSTNLPHAYAGESQDQQATTNSERNVSTELIDYLEENTADMKYMMAVPSSSQGASYVLETGRGVLYMGGFNGGDPVVDIDDLAGLVADGDLRYILWSQSGGRGGGSQKISTWLSESCSLVNDVDLGSTGLQDRSPGGGVPPNFSGGQAPPQRPGDGDGDGGFGPPRGGPNQGSALYDCAS